jgi:hypothetical protein
MSAMYVPLVSAMRALICAGSRSTGAAMLLVATIVDVTSICLGSTTW